MPPDLAAALAALGVPAHARLAVAVSGGADSLALLHLAHALPNPITALTVDHGLRAASATEAAHVATLCAAAGIPHRTLHAHLPPGPAVQARARTARYALLAAAAEECGAAHLLTAHTQDDQAETLLIRLARAAGPAGLAGIRPTRPLTPAVTLVRPALTWPRATLRAALPPHWPPLDDPSNTHPRFARTHARALLAREPMLRPEALAATANHLAQSEDALAWATDRAWASRAHATPTGYALDPTGLPETLVHRLLARLFAEHGAHPRGPDLTRAIARLRSGQTTTLGPLRLHPAGPLWHARPLGTRTPPTL